jgi:23S rRNA (cytidine1920-2'-O)/16S rRNA (cytidine1409-2'-O)-methyltransferase
MSPKRPSKKRIDLLLVEQGLVASRNVAQRLIMANKVTVDGKNVDKPGTPVPTNAQIAVAERPPYVSRGGTKLEAALNAFDVTVNGIVAADVGASTGGFTDCLLQRGTRKVYAIDVGYGQLAWTLRQDARVVVMERTNARHLETLPEPVQLVTIDASFISLTLILPRVCAWLQPGGYVIPLIKPQFEAGRRQVGKGGVIRDPRTHYEVLRRILRWARDNDMPPLGLIRSPLTGPAGNVEFLAWLQKTTAKVPMDIEGVIDAVLS